MNRKVHELNNDKFYHIYTQIIDYFKEKIMHIMSHDYLVGFCESPFDNEENLALIKFTIIYVHTHFNDGMIMINGINQN